MKELELLQACRAGETDLVALLLEDARLVSVDVESEGKRRTPLLIAARSGRRDIVECVPACQLLGWGRGGLNPIIH